MPEELHRPYIRIRGTRLGARYKVANVLGPEYKDAPEREAEETRANAVLIAAAPCLLAALQRLVHPMADDEDREHAEELIARITESRP